MSNNQCDAKVFYDTEFEATIAAARASYDFAAPMVPYRHGRHWHIGNKRKELRSKNRPFNRTYCEACRQYMKPGRYERHVTMERHKYLERKMKEGVA